MNDVSVKKLELERLRINAMAFLSEDYHLIQSKKKKMAVVYILCQAAPQNGSSSFELALLFKLQNAIMRKSLL